MSIIDVNKLKVGVTFEEDNVPYKVMKYEFTKMGRGNANIKVRCRNLLSGAIVNKSYLSGRGVEGVELKKVQMQYLYSDNEKAYFMDKRTFEQLEIDLSVLGEDKNYLVEGQESWVVSWNDRVLGVEIAPSVEMKVKETEPWVKGNSVSNVYKPATLESGLVVQVPLFIKQGEVIKVNTTSGSYVNRVTEK